MYLEISKAPIELGIVMMMVCASRRVNRSSVGLVVAQNECMELTLGGQVLEDHRDDFDRANHENRTEHYEHDLETHHDDRLRSTRGSPLNVRSIVARSENRNTSQCAIARACWLGVVFSLALLINCCNGGDTT